jgi:hypothetical protein
MILTCSCSRSLVARSMVDFSTVFYTVAIVEKEEDVRRIRSDISNGVVMYYLQ